MTERNDRSGPPQRVTHRQVWVAFAILGGAVAGIIAGITLFEALAA
ncbi:MAG: hypothetical protein ACE5FA_14340 [Dehalococcoidia bacterium]